jgi:hypothetical protein
MDRVQPTRKGGDFEPILDRSVAEPPEEEQRTLNAEAEEYRNEADYCEATKLSPGARRALHVQLSSRALFQ